MLRRMRSDSSLNGVPVIAVSSLPESVVRDEAPGVEAYLRKPYTGREILAAIGRALSGRG